MPILLAKRKACGFTDQALELISGFSQDRRQRVKSDGIYSDWEPIKVGVPQGSLLGPLLFNIYSNDLNFQVTNTSSRLYADDTTEYAPDVSPPVLEYIINSDLHILATWLRQNYLQINASKTETITIRPVPYRYNFSVDNNEVYANDTLKILSVCYTRS